MLHYLDEATARRMLIEIRQYTEETAPTIPVLTVILQNLEAYLHGWLGYCPAPSEYSSILHTNSHGYVILPEYPVLSINSVQPIQPVKYLSTSTPVSTNPIMFSYGIGSQWEVNSTIIFSEYRGSVQVEYTAGYQPLPDVFKLTVFQALQKSLRQDTPGDLSFLNNPSRDTQSLSIPAVSKSWKVSSTKTPNETEGDRLFSFLSEYRRHYRF